MSSDPSPFMSWRGLILSLKRDTPEQRQYIEGILFTLHRIIESPDKAQITQEQFGWLEELFDRLIARDQQALVSGGELVT